MKLLIAIAFLAVANGMPEAVRLPEPALPQFESSSLEKEAVRVVDAPEVAGALIETVKVVNALEDVAEEAQKNIPEIVSVVDVADESFIDNAKIAPSELESIRLAIPGDLRHFLHDLKYNKPFLRSNVPQMEDVLLVKEAVKVIEAPQISDAPIEAVNVVNAFEGIPEEAVKNMPEVNPEAVRVVDVAVEDSIDRVKIVETPLGTIRLAPSELESIRLVLPDDIRHFARDLQMNAHPYLR